MDETVFDEMERNVLEILVERNFESDLIEFESVEWVLVRGQFGETTRILHYLLNVKECSFQVVCPGQDDLVKLLIVVSYAEVEVEHC